MTHPTQTFSETPAFNPFIPPHPDLTPSELAAWEARATVWEAARRASVPQTAPCFYVPPMEDTPEALAERNARAAEWEAGRAARIASGEEPPMRLVPDFAA